MTSLRCSFLLTLNKVCVFSQFEYVFSCCDWRKLWKKYWQKTDYNWCGYRISYLAICFYNYWLVSVPFSKFDLVAKTFLLELTPKLCLPLYFIKSDIIMMFTKVVVTQKKNTENFRNFPRKRMYWILQLQTCNQWFYNFGKIGTPL